MDNDSFASVDEAAQRLLEQLLQGIQNAWSRHDLNALRELVTPEMLSYFSEQLAEQASRGLLVSCVQLHGLVPVAGRGGSLRPAEVVVGDDQLGKRATGGDPGERGADAARAYQENTHGPILDLS